jgi:rubrerythrin
MSRAEPSADMSEALPILSNVAQFLAHAIRLEHDAARRFEDLSRMMESAGNQEVERLFRRLADLSRLHLSSATARGGFRELPQLSFDEFQWPDGVTPEAAGWRGVDPMLDVSGALQLALEGEQTGQAWYAGVARGARDPEVLAMAHEFAEEEAQHVCELQRWIARYAANGQAQ